ncbi:photosynthetic NDH subunit of lumenal location 3, chloroplastic [Cucurbita pepo subsp. pepo]|uniref:photosynthetic NDH subunit of lumenal location 3, chloroplastic n=1 Tax=Cucurbita pepo subsp. pepo TaxID=3664 RepID=UPI000C9D527C|nr:photosynthetic NDH subunit of lumenal location 3, chloroplastic [Cucurbita pepo subsp. pepo]
MARLANLNGVSEKFSAIPKLSKLQKTRKRSKITGRLEKQAEVSSHEISLTRRLALTSLASVALFGNAPVEIASANEYWLDGPLPIPSVYNNIANEKTGTRSFLKMGIYIANIGTEGRKYRLKRYAFDLMAMADLIGKDTLNYVRKYLRLKSTFMYYDFDNVISAAEDGEKQPLTDLANRLFDNFEKLEDAAKQKNLSETEAYYQQTTPILQEVMDRMA